MGCENNIQVIKNNNELNEGVDVKGYKLGFSRSLIGKHIILVWTTTSIEDEPHRTQPHWKIRNILNKYDIKTSLRFGNLLSNILSPQESSFLFLFFLGGGICKKN